MKKLIVTGLFFIAANFANAQYDHQNINLLGVFTDSSVVAEPVYDIRFQACWGWADSVTGKEYGILGSTAGTYIVDVSNPSNPVQVDYIPHHQNDAIWHEYKTYKNYLYIISDDAGQTLQIADLSSLPDSVTMIYDSTGVFEHAHALFIDNDKLYVASVSKNNTYSSMNVYSLANPQLPVLLRRLDQDYPFINQVHDMFVSNDTVYASCGFQGLFIFTYDSATNLFSQIGSWIDGGNFYNHSSFLSPDHKTLYLCEEVPDGRPVSIIDVTDIGNPSLIDTFYSNQGATPHNPEVIDNKLIVAYYQDGLYIYDITNPVAPIRMGYFDTYPDNPPGTYFGNAYQGCWSTYAELPSGILLAGDMQRGLFCLDISNVNSVNAIPFEQQSVYPNPATDHLIVERSSAAYAEITDMTGRIFFRENLETGRTEIKLNEIPCGIYILKLTGKDQTESGKFIVR